MNNEAAVGMLALVCVILFVWAMFVTADWRETASELVRLQLSNPHAHLLGRTVEAKVYEGSNWERMVVVAVSWRGAVCVRPERDLETKGRWIRKDLAPYRVREVEKVLGK